MVFYAQVDEVGNCVGVSQLAGEVEAPNLILLDKMYYDLLGSVYIEGNFIKYERDEEGLILKTEKFNLQTGEYEVVE